MAKRTIKLNLKLPSGVTATPELEQKVTDAAKKAIDDSIGEYSEAQRIAKQFAAKGVDISPEEVMQRRKSGGHSVKKKSARKGAKKGAKKKSARKRVTLSQDQKNQMVEDLKGGMTGSAAARKYGVSQTTVMNVKRGAGMTQSRK